MTTELAEKPKTEPMVLVLCDGIAVDTGFNMAPDGLSPSFINFSPGKPSEMPKVYADYLVSQDPTKFSIVKSDKKAAVAEDETETDTNADSPEAKKAAREAIRAAREAAQKKKDDAAAARKAKKEAAKTATAK